MEAALLFGSFIGTTQGSDFSSASMSGLRPSAFPDLPAANCSAGTDEISQFLCKEFPCMLRVGDRAGPFEGSRVPERALRVMTQGRSRMR